MESPCCSPTVLMFLALLDWRCPAHSVSKNECHWYIQPSGALAYLNISQLQNITFREISICCQGQRRTACLNVTPVWTAKGSILRLSKLELAVMQCHYSTKAGHGCWGTVQNGTVGELKSFYLGKRNAICRNYWYHVLSLTFSEKREVPLKRPTYRLICL